MQYAIVEGKRSEPLKGLRGNCIGCGKAVIAKCGSIKLHHWAHETLKDCDSWQENETEWHRAWKNNFPESFREKPFNDKTTGEIHRADIHTDNGITIEFQNSSISIEEVKSRDLFYQKLIWVVNGIHFQNNFEIQKNIPNPSDRILDDYVFSENGNVLYREKDLLNDDPLKEVFGFQSFKSLKVSDNYYRFDWKNPKSAWMQSKSFVFFDFGCDNLYLLKLRKQIEYKYFYLQKFKKSDFIRKYSS